MTSRPKDIRQLLRDLADQKHVKPPYLMSVAYDYCEIAARRGLEDAPFRTQLRMYAKRYFVNERTFTRAVRAVAQRFTFTPAYPARGDLEAEEVITALIQTDRATRFQTLPSLWPKIAREERPKALAFFWTDTEVPSRHRAAWLRRFLECGYVSDQSRKPSGPLVVYRGVSSPRFARSLSWTLDQERAEWFARRFSFEENGRVYQATIDADKILGYFNERNEHEVVVNHHNLEKLACVGRGLSRSPITGETTT